MRDEEKRESSDPIRLSSKRSSKRAASRIEFDFIDRIRQRTLRPGNLEKDINSSLITHHSSLIKGVGDDTAVFRTPTGYESLITVDLLVEDIDFRRGWTNPRLLGHKALAVSLSDIAAMGGVPRWALLSVGVPREVWDQSFLDQFYEGFFALADEYNVTLIGGDISRTPERIIIDSIVLGEAKRGRALMRSGARAGDLIFVTGSLGGAAAGLQLLERGGRVSKNMARKNRLSARERILLRQLQPQPRVAWGRFLGEKRLATAMIDLSDGLSSDLGHLCRESRVGAGVEASRIPVDPFIEQLQEASILSTSFNALSLALDGGEDYELLFTVDPRRAARLPDEIEGVPITHIGEITDKPNRITLIEGKRARVLEPAGFNHFKTTRRN